MKKQINKTLSFEKTDDPFDCYFAHSNKPNDTFVITQVDPNNSFVTGTQKIFLTKPMMEQIIREYKRMSRE